MFDRRYASLRASQPMRDDEGEAFDDHVFACIVAAALDHAACERTPILHGLGLTNEEAARFFAYAFPSGVAPLCLMRAPRVELQEEEQMLRQLLAAHRRERDEAADWLVPLVARRAMRDDHLWQDLGLLDRSELTRLLQRHFPALHAGNANNMRWKKYFYRQICESEGFVLCSAPHCSVCVDFQSCFGDEDGLSRLATLARSGGTSLPEQTRLVSL